MNTTLIEKTECRWNTTAGALPPAGLKVMAIGRIPHGGYYLGQAYMTEKKVLGIITLRKWYSADGMRIKVEYWKYNGKTEGSDHESVHTQKDSAR